MQPVEFWELLRELGDLRFMPRSHCGPWTPLWTAWAITNGVAYSIAYVGIPVGLLVYRARRRHAGPLARRLLLRAAIFVFGCGVHHVCHDLIVWRWPAYKAFTLAATPGAVASVWFLASLPYAIREAQSWPTQEEWERMNDELQAKNDELAEKGEKVLTAYEFVSSDNARLNREIARLKRKKAVEELTGSQERRLDQLLTLQEAARCSEPS